MIGKKLRELREGKGLLLRQVAALLEVDTAYVSKMERGDKNIKREFIEELAKIYKADTNELLSLWLAEKVYEILKDEKNAAEALKIVEQNLKSTK